MLDSSLQTHKSDLRKSIKNALRNLSASQRFDEETKVNTDIVKNLLRKPRGTLLAYAAFSIELNIDPVIAFAREHGWRIALPLITDIPNGVMELRHVNSLADLIPGPMGIREPAPQLTTKIDPAEIDLALIPAWGFNPRTGARLGKGGGFYDRLLANPAWRATTYGIAFRCQLHSKLPVEPHDRHVDGIFTPDGLQRPR